MIKGIKINEKSLSITLLNIKNLLIKPLKGGIPATDKRLIDNIILKVGLIKRTVLKLLKSKIAEELDCGSELLKKYKNLKHLSKEINFPFGLLRSRTNYGGMSVSDAIKLGKEKILGGCQPDVFEIFYATENFHIIDIAGYKQFFNSSRDIKGDENNILFENQFGFRKKYSTSHALLSITEKIRSYLDSGTFACGVFVDLEKAFDTVNHKILCNKLPYYGFRGKIESLIKSFLENRRHHVSINQVLSSNIEINCGVP